MFDELWLNMLGASSPIILASRGMDRHSVTNYNGNREETHRTPVSENIEESIKDQQDILGVLAGLLILLSNHICIYY